MKWEFNHDEEHYILNAVDFYISHLTLTKSLVDRSKVSLKGIKIPKKQVLQKGIELGNDIVSKMKDKVIAECKDHH